eukprot:CAMPEP_0194780608 /NCGR_PEP_ID=MMETSP0323_2-20130528/74081_1 /TAXON_ID=2866 ORGANISM="Crypthecodinium cohnii, Strain Seligo" /NCGR_SAMPLE_ID=MMETSP0323_2 /ASSEMBLY_ACC=CAM_ASM_000346 /LENGTH=36 /DNA_ID= /DNA_START= /DNA_END= /DNA_ORIENTATION=
MTPGCGNTCNPSGKISNAQRSTLMQEDDSRSNLVMS